MSNCALIDDNWLVVAYSDVGAKKTRTIKVRGLNPKPYIVYWKEGEYKKIEGEFKSGSRGIYSIITKKANII